MLLRCLDSVQILVFILRPVGGGGGGEWGGGVWTLVHRLGAGVILSVLLPCGPSLDVRTPCSPRCARLESTAATKAI